MKEILGGATVAVLGGAGGMGRFAVSVASTYAEIGEVVVADRDGAGAERIAAEASKTAKTRLRASRVDVSDPVELRGFLRGVDVVLNTTGPFYRLGVSVLRESIAAGCHYLDICDDWEPTIEMLSLHPDAVSRGVLAVIGLGASPGASNLLARVACEGLERVEDLYTAWPVDGAVEEVSVEESFDPDGPIPAALIHWMQQLSGAIETIEEGERVVRPPLEPVEIRYPQLGSGTGYTVGHPEPITLKDRMKVRGASATLMLLKPSTAAFLDVLRNDLDGGRLSLEEAAAQVMKPGWIRQAKAWRRSRGFAGSGPLPPFFAWARGEREGQPVIVAAHLQAAVARGSPRYPGSASSRIGDRNEAVF